MARPARQPQTSPIFANHEQGVMALALGFLGRQPEAELTFLLRRQGCQGRHNMRTGIATMLCPGARAPRLYGSVATRMHRDDMVRRRLALYQHRAPIDDRGLQALRLDL